MFEQSELCRRQEISPHLTMKLETQSYAVIAQGHSAYIILSFMEGGIHFSLPTLFFTALLDQPLPASQQASLPPFCSQSMPYPLLRQAFASATVSPAWDSITLSLAGLFSSPILSLLSTLEKDPLAGSGALGHLPNSSPRICHDLLICSSVSLFTG